MNNMNKTIIGSLIGALSLLNASGAQASSVEINPAAISVAAGSTFEVLSIQAVGFVDGTGTPIDVSTGGFHLSWDSVLSLDSTPVFSTVMVNGGMTDDPLFSQIVLNDAVGNQTTVPTDAVSLDVEFTGCPLVGVCNALSNTFDIITNLFFTVDPAFTGTAIATLGLDIFAPDWFGGGAFPAKLAPQPTYGTATINVTATSAVPVPAAVWLFGSGLLGMAGVARRRGKTAA